MPIDRAYVSVALAHHELHVPLAHAATPRSLYSRFKSFDEKYTRRSVVLVPTEYRNAILRSVSSITFIVSAASETVTVPAGCSAASVIATAAPVVVAVPYLWGKVMSAVLVGVLVGGWCLQWVARYEVAVRDTVIRSTRR